MNKRLTAWMLPAAVVAGLTLTGCDGGTGGDGDVEDFWPLSAGNSWTYRVTLTGETYETAVSDVQDDWSCMSGTLALKCSGERVWEQTWPPDEDLSDQQLLLSPPLTEGSTWTFNTSGGEAELTRADYTYSTADGDWEHCYQVTYGSGYLAAWSVYGRGIGLVAAGLGTVELFHLVEYTLY